MLNYLLKIWMSSDALTQIILIVLVVYGIIKGVIKVPKWIELKKSSEVSSHGISVHSECANFPSLKLIVIKAIEQSLEIQRIQINDTLNEQMNEADDLYVDIRDILKKNYITLYKRRHNWKIESVLKEQDIITYIAMIDNTESLLKGMTRRFLKKNHFIDKSDEEFRLYINQRAEDYQKAVSQFLDERYNSDVFKLSREEVYESNIKNCLPEITEKVKSFFYTVRTISRKKQKKIEKLKEDIQEFL